MVSHQSATKFYSAFNGRYFRDDVETILQVPSQGESLGTGLSASGEKIMNSSAGKVDRPMKGSLASKSYYSVSEVMHTIFLSDIIVLGQDFGTYDINFQYQRMAQKKQGAFGVNLYFEELPTCPLCLERLDSSMSGLQFCMLQDTQINQVSPMALKEADLFSLEEDGAIASEAYVFLHAVKWPYLERKCLVCQSQKAYDQAMQASPKMLHEEETDEAAVDRVQEGQPSPLKCAECKNVENLWICLCCGYVGCGRYNLRHAVEHNVQTSHNFSIEVNSHRIWNYLGDHYVHRIIQTKLGNESNTKYEEIEAEVLGQAFGKSI
jgi:hypothetical protein